MERSEVLQSVKEVIQEIAPNTIGLEFNLDTLLVDDLGLDSLKFVQITVGLEDKHDIEFEVEDLDPRNYLLMSHLVELTEKGLKENEGVK